MFRLRGVSLLSWRAFPFRPFSCESLIVQMQNCADEEQVFDLIERNKATLSEQQVGCAFNVLWQFQKQKTILEKNVERVRNHPQFLSLCSVTTDHIPAMSDVTLVDVLYSIKQFAVESHHPLIEALVTEGWRRLERQVLWACHRGTGHSVGDYMEYRKRMKLYREKVYWAPGM